MGEISPSCIAREMILAMLSNLPWASSLMESCFSQAFIEALRYFHVAGVITEKSRLVPPKAIPTGSATPLASAAMDIPPVSTVDVIRLVSAMLNIVMDRFIFWPSVFLGNISIIQTCLYAFFIGFMCILMND